MKFIRQSIVFLGWAFFLIFGLSILAFIMGISGLMSGNFMTPQVDALKIKSGHAVGVIDLAGEILTSDQFNKDLKAFVDHDKIKAIVVRIDSPGGAVGASEEIFEAIKEANQKKPVICSMASIAASGGLYAAMGCPKIVANKGTLTGSIGVIMMSPNVQELIERFGIFMTVVKSGEFKDTGSPFRKVTEADKAVLQVMVDSAYSQFVETIATARHLDTANVKKFADGRVFTGEQALELGLIDEIGNLSHAAELALKLSGDEGKPELVYPKKATGVFALLQEQVDESSLIRFLSNFQGPRLLYRGFTPIR